jgi:hypothetical protein
MVSAAIDRFQTAAKNNVRVPDGRPVGAEWMAGDSYFHNRYRIQWMGTAARLRRGQFSETPNTELWFVTKSLIPAIDKALAKLNATA